MDVNSRISNDGEKSAFSSGSEEKYRVVPIRVFLNFPAPPNRGSFSLKQTKKIACPRIEEVTDIPDIFFPVVRINMVQEFPVIRKVKRAVHFREVP